MKAIPGKQRKNSVKSHLSAPLRCWDIFSCALERQGQRSRDEAGIRAFLKERKCLLPRQLSELLKEFDTVVITGARYDIVWVNPAFCRITGYSEEECRAGGVGLLFGLLSRTATIREIKKWGRREETLRIRLSFNKRNGENCAGEMLRIPVFNREKVLCHFMVFGKEG